MADSNAQIVLSAKDSTATAFQSVQARLTTLKATLIGVVGGQAAFDGLSKAADLLGDAFEKIDPSSVLEAADALDKLSQRSGIAVEALGALEFQGKLLGLSNDDLGTSLKRLNVNIAAAARGQTTQADAFKAIGVAVVDSNGKVRSAGDVLNDIADKFASYSDGANKVALANALGGKSFELLIPLLNQGSAGFKAARDELEKLGGAIGSDLAAKARQFEENLTRLSVAAGALKVLLAGSVIDTLVDTSNKLIEGAKNSSLFSAALSAAFDNIRDAASKTGFGAIFGGISGSGDNSAADATKKVDDLTTRIQRLQAVMAKHPDTPFLPSQTAELAQLQKQLTDAQAAATAPQAAATAAFRRSEAAGANFSPAPKEAPKLPDPALLAAAQALLNKQIEGQLKVISDGLEKEKALFTFADQQLQDQFSHGELSIDAFYDAKEKALQDYLVDQLAGLNKEIDIEKRRQALSTNPKDQQDAANKIKGFQDDIAKATLAAGQAATTAETQRSRAAEDFQKNLATLDEQIKSLSGDEFGAALLKNATAVANAKKLLGQDNNRPQAEAELAALQKQLDIQANVNKAQSDYTLITQKAQLAEDAFNEAANRQGLSQSETDAGIKAIRDDELKQLDALIQKNQDLFAATANPQYLIFYEQLKQARDKAFDAKDPNLARFQDVVNQTGSTLASGLDDAIASGKKLSDVFKDVETSLVRLLAHDFLTAPLATSLENFVKGATGIGGQTSGGLSGSTGLLGLLGGLFGPSTGTATVGGASTLTSTDISSLFGAVGYGHAGGIAGAFPTTMPVSPSVFAHADRYHGGGIVGGETPAILQKGEEVITQSDPRHRWNGGMNGSGQRPVTVQNTFVLQQPASRDTQSQIAVQAGRGIQRAMARDT